MAGIGDSFMDSEFKAPLNKDVKSYAEFLLSTGSGIRPYIVKGTYRVAILYKVTRQTRAALQDIAASMGYVYAGQGNVTDLLEAIGQGLYVLIPNPAIDPKDNSLLSGQ